MIAIVTTHFVAGNMANALYGQGKYPQAEAEYRAVLKLQQRVLGPTEF